jgi:hypothetical protein
VARAVDIAPMTWTLRPDWTNVKASPYNAQGDGSTDDTAAIQSAINHVETSGGGTLYFPPGTYKITSSLEIIGSYPDQVCNLVGCGINTTVKWYGPAGGAMVWANGASACKYEGFVWDGGGTGGLTGTGGAGCAFLEYSSNPFNGGYSDYMTGIRHENESFRNFTVPGNFTPQGLPPDTLNPSGFPPAAIISGLANPLGSVPVGELTAVNCKFQYCTTALYNPVELYNNFMWVMDGCEFDNNGTGFQCGTWGAGGSDFILMNSHFEGSTVTDIGYGGGIRGLRLTSSGSAAFYTGFMGGAGLQDCWIDGWTNPSYAMSFISSGQARVVDCTFTNPPAGAAPPIALGTQTADTQTMLFSNNVATNFPGQTILNHYGAEPSNANIDWIPAGSMGANVTSPHETFLKSTYPPDATHILDVTAAPYNADTSGTHDVSAAVQAAVNDAASANNGTCVYFPNGLYRLANTVNCTGGNYSIEGEGYHSEVWWAAGSGGTMFTVSNPQNIAFRNIHLAALFSSGTVQDPFYYGDPSHTLPNSDGTTITGIKETATGASYASYDTVIYDGCGLGNIWATGGDATGPGLVLSGLPAGSTVYIPFLDSPLTVIDCGQAQIFSMKANIDAVKVSGATLPKTGFLGLAVAEGGVGVGRPPIADDPSLINFTVTDNQNLLVGPYYSEQCDNDLNMSGGSGTTPGHVAIDGLLVSPSPACVSIGVNNYTGRLFYSNQEFFGGYEDPSFDIAPVQVNQTGSNPVNMVLADTFFYGPTPSISLDTGAHLVATLSENGANGSPTVNLGDSPSPLLTSDDELVAQGLDDFRQLGALNLAVEYGQVNPSGLVAYWKLDEPSSPSADSSMSGYTGTWQNGPTFTTDHPALMPYTDAGAMSFNGSNQFINMGSPAGLPTGYAPRTLCGWGKASNTAGGWRWIAAYGSPSGSQAMFIGMNGTTLDGGAYGDDLEVPNFWDNNWHFIALTYDGTTAKLYADGNLVASDTRNWNLVPYECLIGEQVNNAGEYWNGEIDDVRIYNRALSAAEIAALIGNTNNPVTGPVNPTPFSGLGYVPGGWTLTNNQALGSGVRNLTVTQGGSPFSNDLESMLFVDSTATGSGSTLQASESFANATPVDSPVLETFDVRINSNGPQTDLWLWGVLNWWYGVPGIHICGNGSLSANVGGSDTYLGQLMMGVWYRMQIVIGAPSAGTSNATLYVTPWYGNGAGPTIHYTIDGIPFATWMGFTGFGMDTGTGPGAQQSISLDNLSIIPGASPTIPAATGSTANQTDELAGLVAHWKLDEMAGPYSFDSSGEFDTGTWTNGPTISTDGFLTFNGSSHVTMGNPVGLPIGTAARTICGWARSPATGQSGYGMFASYGSPANGEGFWIGGNGTSLSAGSWGYDLPDVPGVWDGNWHFIALTYDGTTASLYIDGTLRESAAETWNLVPSVCYVGCYMNGGAGWNGSVGDVRIYDRALSAAEVSTLAAGSP